MACSFGGAGPGRWIGSRPEHDTPPVWRWDANTWPTWRYGEKVPEMSAGDFQNLLAFRTSLRRFLHWSQTQARAVGLTPAQHQLLVAIKGHAGNQDPTISDLAEYLLLRHHSVVELVDRAAAAGAAATPPSKPTTAAPIAKAIATLRARNLPAITVSPHRRSAA